MPQYALTIRVDNFMVSQDSLEWLFIVILLDRKPRQLMDYK